MDEEVACMATLDKHAGKELVAAIEALRQPAPANADADTGAAQASQAADASAGKEDADGSSVVAWGPNQGGGKAGAAPAASVKLPLEGEANTRAVR